MNHKLIHLIEQCVDTASKLDITKLTLQLSWDAELETYNFCIINDNNIRSTGYCDGCGNTGITSVQHIDFDVQAIPLLDAMRK